MPLYEFECVDCKNNLKSALKAIEKKFDKKALASILKKYKNIKGIQIYDLWEEKMLESIGFREEDNIEIDLYFDEGKKMVLFYASSFRFSELIFSDEDEKNLQTACCNKGKIERVISSFSYTQDLSTDPPKPPGQKDLHPLIQGKLNITGMVEAKDQPANIKAANRYKHQFINKSKTKLL